MKNMKILIVDDQFDNLVVMQAVLQQFLPDVEVLICQNGPQGLEMVASEMPDGVLLDMQMPEISGVEICQRIKDNPKTAHIPVILITAHKANTDLKVKGLEAGADDFLSRPIDNEELAARVKVMLRISVAEDKLRKENVNLESIIVEKNKILTLMLESTGDCVWQWNIESGEIIYTESWIKHLGYEYKTSFDIDWVYSVTPEESQIEFKRLLNDYNQGKTPFLEIDSQVLKSDGNWIWTTTRGINTHFDENGKPTKMMGTIRDISERKEKEQEREWLISAISQAAETIVITDVEGTILYANPAFEKTTGYTVEESLGKNPRFLKSGVQDKKFYDQMWDTIKSGKVWSGHIVNKHKNGNLFTEESVITPIYDDGKIINYVAVKRDITKELQLEKQLHQAEKMEAIGHLAGGIAHDFNNILGGIIGYADLSLGKLDVESSLYHNIQQIMLCADRAKNLVKQILTFSRKSNDVKTPVYIKVILKEITELLRASLPSTIEIVNDIGIEKYPILADSTKIHEILMNLCTNAAHAMQEKGMLTITAVQQEIKEELNARLGIIKPGTYTKITISDTGSGMTPDVIKHIFEPFFTTKSVGEGTGMGLSVVFGIVQSYNGNIIVKSEQGKGTSFEVYFPVTNQKVGNAERNTQVVGGNESIMFVDDEKILCNISKGLLQSLGYKVICFSSSIDAFEYFAEAYNDFDLLITDQTMPGMTGVEFARKVHEIRADIPILLCTGYSKTINEDQIAELGISGFAMKPLRRKELAKKIREILD